MGTKRPKRATTRTPPPGALQDVLRAAGLRCTESRVAVLGYLLDRAAPASHADLCDALKRDGFDRATLYRNLIDLTDAGIVARTDLGDHVWRFEARQRAGSAHAANHPHFVCSDCGAVSCLEDVGVRITRGPRAPKSLATKNVSVQITALCDSCA